MGANDPRLQRQGEAALLDYVERVGKQAAGRQGLHVRMSSLRPANRSPQRLRIAALTLEPLVSGFDGILFRLQNDDFVVFFKDASAEAVDQALMNLMELYADDPAIRAAGENLAGFCQQFDLARGFAAVQNFAREALEAARNSDAANQSALLSHPVETQQKTLDPKSLASIQTAIAQADLTSVIRRQAVCAVAPGTPPKPVFTEVFTSICALRDILTPDVDIHGSRWLFQELTSHLDRRVIAYLGHRDDATLTKAFSVNLNVGSVISDEFMAFDQKLGGEARRTVVIELQLVDVMADLDSFRFSRNFLHQRNYRFCLDGLTCQSLAVINCARLGVDLIKVIWSPELHDEVNRKDSAVLEALKSFDANRVILIRCDDELAFETGKALGTHLYQGHLIDKLLKKTGQPQTAS
ncbi:MAG: hypothetical protein ACFCUQ_18345 [Kiloniellales bacterium]